MRTIMQNKRMMLSLLACVLLTAAVIGAGTWAWFTGSATIEDETFTMSTLKLDAVAGDGYRILDFVTGNAANIDQQKLLEEDEDGLELETWLRYFNPDRILSPDQFNDYLNDAGIDSVEVERLLQEHYRTWGEFVDALEAILAETTETRDATATLLAALDDFALWQFNYGSGVTFADRLAWGLAQLARGEAETQLENLNNAIDDLNDGNYTGDLAVLRALAYDANVAWAEARDALNELYKTMYGSIVLRETDKVSPGSLILGTYVFEVNEDSNISAYFRIKEAVINNADSVAGAAVQYADNFYALTLSNGYYYCPVPVNAGDEIIVNIGAYVHGENNKNIVQGVTFEFGESGVELIQANNNAVWLVEGWNALPVGFYK